MSFPEEEEPEETHPLSSPSSVQFGKPPGKGCPWVQGLGMGQAEYPQDPRQDLRSMRCLAFIFSNEDHVVQALFGEEPL